MYESNFWNCDTDSVLKLWSKSNERKITTIKKKYIQMTSTFLENRLHKYVVLQLYNNYIINSIYNSQRLSTLY